jgi:phage terminase large subunit-like protein
MANAVIERDAAGNRKLNKAKSYGRIDVAVAAVMAVRALAVTEPAVNVEAMIG